MNYLIAIRKSPHLSELRVVPEGFVERREREEWAVRTGAQVRYIGNAMHRDLKQWYLHGSYQLGALYAIEFDELVAVLEDRMGPHDRARAERLSEALASGRAEARERQMEEVGYGIEAFLGGALDLIWALLRGTIRVVAWIIGTIIFIRWSKRGRR